MGSWGGQIRYVFLGVAPRETIASVIGLRVHFGSPTLHSLRKAFPQTAEEGSSRRVQWGRGLTLSVQSPLYAPVVAMHSIPLRAIPNS
jgi:hypothetical protein